jgi:deoxyribose-phosphate aldolase
MWFSVASTEEMQNPMDYSYKQIAKMIDHSLLNPILTVPELETGCKLAGQYGTASVCILPHYAPRCAELLSGTGVMTSTAIGFPHGGQTSSVKLFEADRALEDGATELDMVINISQAKSGNWDYVGREIRDLTLVTHDSGAKIKVIFENFYLTDGEKIRLCEICGASGVDWVKTSTGYAGGGATMEDLTLMRKHSPASVQVKAAGGVRDLDTLLKVRALGVTRVGSTRTALQLEDCRVRLGLAPINATQGTASAGKY